MTRINTNISSLNAQKSLARSNTQLQTSLTRLSTGLRINVGKDDPAGLIASEVLRSDITSVQKAISNSERANQLIATADSALGQVSSLLNDIRGLVSESANTGVLSEEQIAANQLQVDSSLEAIDRIAQTTNFGGRRLLDGSLDFLSTANASTAAARGTFGTGVDARASGTVGSTVDNYAAGSFGSADSVAVGSIGTAVTDSVSRGSFGTDVDNAATVTISGSSGGAEVSFTALADGAAANGYSISYAASAAGPAVAFDGTAKTLVFQVSSTATSADVVSALSTNASAAAVFTAAVANAGTISAGNAGTTVSGSDANSITLSSVGVGSRFNNTTVTFAFGASAGAETAAFNTATNELTVTINTASNTAAVVSAINTNGTFAASTSGAGLGTYAAGSTASVTTGGAANNQIVLSAVNTGAQYGNLTVTYASGGSAGASYNTGTNTLALTFADGTGGSFTTTAQLVSAINGTGIFNASTTGSGLGTYTSAASSTGVTTGGSANGGLTLSATTYGSQYNSTTVTVNTGAALGAETATYNSASNTLTVTVNDASTVGSVASAINTNGTFDASFAGTGTDTYNFTGSTTSVTSGGSADNRIVISAVGIGAAFNATDVIFQTGAALGSETAAYNTAANTLTVTLNQSSTAAAVVSALNSTGTFTASVASGSSGLGTFSAGTNADVTTGGSSDNRITLSATSNGTQYNDTTFVVQTGAAAGAETAAYNTATNTMTLTINQDSTATQVASAISTNGVFAATVAAGSLGTGTFGTGTTENVTSGAGTGNVRDLKIDQANFGTASSIGVQVQLDAQATKANLTYSSGPLASAVSLEIGGQKGFEVFNFGAGSTTTQIAAAVNLVSDATGVSAEVDDVTNELTFNSTEYGSDAFVSAKAINGTFATTANSVATERVNGTDVALRINGIKANGNGLNASINTSTLDISFNVREDLSDGASFDFSITGGGAVFQLGPDVVSNQQARLGIQGVSTASLGGVAGRLFELRSGGAKSLATNTTGAAAVVDQVISSVTGLRGRLGAFQKTTLETNIFTLNDALENLSDAESSIRDADFAVESARLTRAQILVQSGTSVLGIANQSPQNVLSLLR